MEVEGWNYISKKYFSGKYSRKYVKICEKVVIPAQIYEI